MSVQLASQEFATPDKGGPKQLSSAMDSSFQQSSDVFTSATGAPKYSVTPSDPDVGIKKESKLANSRNAVTPQVDSNPSCTVGGKHVRFGSEDEKRDSGSESSKPSSTESPSSKRAVVSRRGGRYVSPGRSLLQSSSPTPPCGTTNNEASVLEYKTVPSLYNANSGGLVSLPSECEKESSESPLVSRSTPQNGSSYDDADKSFVSSPVPSSDRFKKTPTKSPPFRALPSLEDAKLQSPVGIFLSPHPPTPSYKNLRDSFDKDEEKEEKQSDDNVKTDKIRDYSKSFAATPTDFTIDYGKGHQDFDNSNVLNWLQSPTANGLFSPGGGLNLSSIMNTPKGVLAPRTPGTPTVSTSFFFSDVASLPRNGDFTPQKGDKGKSPKRGGLSNIICISPLASRNRHGNANAANTPINYNDVFASPNPLLGDSPTKGSKDKAGLQQANTRDPCLDAVHLAERDLRLDEDLSVLLQLAGNTPRDVADRVSSGNVAGGHVFRGQYNKGGDSSSDRENLPGLQLPIIGDRDGDTSAARLSRKSFSRDHGEGSDGFVTANRPIQHASSSVRDKEMYAEETSSTAKTHIKQEVPSKPVEELKPRSLPLKKQPLKKIASAPVHYQPPAYAPRPPQDVYGYPPPMPTTGMRPGGRMSVVVGGPPPSSRGSKANSAGAAGRHSAPHRHPGYPPENPYQAPMSYPPHGHYPHHPVQHMSGMGVHPYHGHYPQPPPHHPHHGHLQPMYGVQHPCSKLPPTKRMKAASKPPKPVKATAKRPSLSDTGKAVTAKKPRKSSSGPKKKNKSPQLTDRADRQKAAATIAAVNVASGGRNDKAAALAAAILRGVTMRPSGKWQAQLYFAGKSRYIGVFDTREKAALAYEIAREKLKTEKANAEGNLTPKLTEAAVNAARKAAFDGVNEKDPRMSGSK